jgi:predicted TIM-barrel fold metal-dependent hydrolase
MDVHASPEPPRSDSGHRVIDCDVHPYVAGGVETIYPYLSAAWRKRFERKRAGLSNSNLTLRFQHPNGSAIRADAAPIKGSVGGSDVGFMCRQLLDEHGVDVAILNCLQTGALAATLAGPEESVVLTAAFNDFFLDKWMPVDPRLKFAMSVPVQDPQQAAREIRRIGRNAQICAVSLPPLNILMGNRYHWPIYKAAQEAGLPILTHVTGTDSIYVGPPMSAGGIPESYCERYVTLSQAAESNVNSLVFTGTLERFPDLKFIFVEYGFCWLLPLLWRMQKTWRELRHEVPWVKKSPIEYVHDRMRFTTQPIDEPPNPRDLDKMIELMGYDNLCFSTDYPHWDNDMPGQTLRSLSADRRRKIFCDNALEALRM